MRSAALLASSVSAERMALITVMAASRNGTRIGWVQYSDPRNVQATVAPRCGSTQARSVQVSLAPVGALQHGKTGNADAGKESKSRDADRLGGQHGARRHKRRGQAKSTGLVLECCPGDQARRAHKNQDQDRGRGLRQDQEGARAPGKAQI